MTVGNRKYSDLFLKNWKYIKQGSAGASITGFLIFTGWMALLVFIICGFLFSWINIPEKEKEILKGV